MASAVYLLYGKHMSEYRGDEGSIVDPSARLHDGVKVCPGSRVYAGAVLLEYVHIDDNSEIGPRSYLKRGVTVGPDVYVGAMALILEDAVICPNPVQSVSSDGRKIGVECTIGRGVLLHDEVELGAGAIVPTQATIAHIGSFGRKNRVITVYGSDEGPRFSLGCNIGVSFSSLRGNILGNAADPGAHTTTTSAGSYVSWLPVFSRMGAVVQAAYSRESALVEELREMRTNLIPTGPL